MKVIIQVAADDDEKAWDLLQRHSPGVALPHRTYVVSEAALRSLAKAKVRFTELSREAAMPAGGGAGERI